MNTKNISKYGINLGGAYENGLDFFDFECAVCGANLRPDERGNSPLIVKGKYTAISFCPHCGANVAD